MGSDEEEDHTAEFVQTSPLFRFEPFPSSYPVGIINREQREQRVFRSLLAIVPGLADHITDEQATEQDIQHIADLVKLLWLGANLALIHGHRIAPERRCQRQI